MANESRKRQNTETLEYATNHKLNWGGNDANYLLDHFREHDHITAIELGRTYQAVTSMRHRLKLFKGGNIRIMLKGNEQKPMPLDEAMQKRNRQIDAGATVPPTIRQVQGGYVMEEGRLAHEVRGANSAKDFVQRVQKGGENG